MPGFRPAIKPPRLRRGDTVAAVTLSRGGPATVPHRYAAGKRQFEEEFGCLMEAFADRSVRAVISTMVHGSGGIIGIDDRWARELNDIGIATFLLDGFTGRGIVATRTEQFQFGKLTMINDAYRALELLATHPRIDSTRIGIFGGSRGGRVALYASLKRFQRMYATPGTGFALYLPFYAPCSTSYVDDVDVVDRLIRLFHGTADDAAPIAHCRSYEERLQKAGKDVELTEYAGTHHGFDNPGAPVRRSGDPVDRKPLPTD